VEFSTDVESAGQAIGVMVLAGQYEFAGHGKALPVWQYDPALQALHWNSFWLGVLKKPFRHVQFELGSQSALAGQTHCAWELEPLTEKVALGHAIV
jgi:hypothetical protein